LKCGNIKIATVVLEAEGDQMQFDQLRRRDFITLLGGAAAAWPTAARAQQLAGPVIGYLGLGSPDRNSPSVAAFREGLAEAGYVADQNVAIEFRWANFQQSLLPQLAADLVRRQVAVIVATGSPNAALAAKAATSTIPIVFSTGSDPVKYGLVASFNRPGGNVTGVNFLSAELGGKRLDLLLQLLPQATTVGYLSAGRESLVFEDQRTGMLAAGRALRREIILLEVRRLDFEAAFTTLAEQRADALIVGTYTLFLEPRNRDKILELAARHKTPAIYPDRQYAVNGGLMSYAASLAESRQVGIYTGRILNGEKPIDLPIMRPTKFEFIINLQTARVLGIEVPPTLLAIADEVIE
jgi:putative ABC transport system substrate-binding protein